MIAWSDYLNPQLADDFIHNAGLVADVLEDRHLGDYIVRREGCGVGELLWSEQLAALGIRVQIRELIP